MSVGEFLLRHEFHRLLECEDDVFIDVGLRHLVAGLVFARCEHVGCVVYDGHVAERADEIEICHRLPDEAFALTLPYRSLRGRSLAESLIDGVAVAYLSPEGVGHVDEVLVCSVDGEVEVW